jgi:hypothetical protein
MGLAHPHGRAWEPNLRKGARSVRRGTLGGYIASHGGDQLEVDHLAPLKAGQHGERNGIIYARVAVGDNAARFVLIRLHLVPSPEGLSLGRGHACQFPEVAPVLWISVSIGVIRPIAEPIGA